ncbi:MAG: hypothetical protein LBV42_01915 [Methanobrevibacter sp.]|jgi:hypothetical protein|nr:hypothetical protein [Methanobrevibacter sp.]
MLKKILSLLLISILVISAIGGVSAKHYTYNVNMTQYETFDLDDWMDDNDISGCFDSKYQRAFQNSEYFITSTKCELFSDIYITAIKVGSGRFEVELGWPFDSDYVDFIVGPRSV